jgi:hypothetical protein
MRDIASDHGIRRGRCFTSTRQRVIVLTFATVADADEWDRNGQPIEVPGHLSSVDVSA